MSGIRGVLRKNPSNPRYFTDETGRAVYLTGMHTWNNLADMGPTDPPAEFDFGYYLDLMGELNHNFIRLWAWDMIGTWNEKDTVRPFPWARTGPGNAVDGKPKFDITKFDAEYFERLRTRVAAAQEKGIYVSIMLFDAWAIFGRNKTRREMHVFAKENNVNGFDLLASDRDDILRDWVTLDNPVVTAAQEAYVAEVIETVNGFDNVLYEISNEAGHHSHEWQERLIGFIRKVESGRPKRHPVGTTGGMQTSNEKMYLSSADYSAPETMAVEGTDEGYRSGAHTWGTAPFDRGRQVVFLDTDHLWGIGGNVSWAWKSFCRGYNVLYMDRCDDFPTAFFEHSWWKEKSNLELRREMGVIRSFAEKIDLNAAIPHNDLASTGYCLANPGKEYLVYQPEAGEFTVQLTAGSYRFEWHDPASGTAGETGTVEARAEEIGFAPPFQGSAVLLLKEAGGA